METFLEDISIRNMAIRNQELCQLIINRLFSLGSASYKSLRMLLHHITASKCEKLWLNRVKLSGLRIMTDILAVNAWKSSSISNHILPWWKPTENTGTIIQTLNEAKIQWSLSEAIKFLPIVVDKFIHQQIFENEAVWSIIFL